MNEQEIIQDVPGYLTRVGMFYLISKHQQVMYQTRGMFHLISKQITLERVFYLISKHRSVERRRVLKGDMQLSCLYMKLITRYLILDNA